MNNIIKICSLKYGNIPHYEWNTTLLENNKKYLLARGEANRKLIHHTRKKVFTFEEPCIQFFSYDEWFTVNVTKTADNNFNYYCDISTPPSFSDNVLSYIDLDFDYIKNEDGKWTLVDQDEFIEHSKKYNYPPELIANATKAKDRLKDIIESNSFPFGGWIESKF